MEYDKNGAILYLEITDGEWWISEFGENGLERFTMYSDGKVE